MSRDRTHRTWVHSIDYKKDRHESPKALVNRGFWIQNTPRFTPLCRLLGHKPVVDGVDMSPMHVAGGRVTPGRRSRWACCDRCGIRLQQPIDSDLEIGQPYTDPLPSHPSHASDVTGARGVIGGQLVIGRNYGGVSAQMEIGSAGNEHTLAAHVHLHHLGGLYLHTERHGTWLQRRLNPTGYDSRVTGIAIDNGHLRWQVWAKRDSSTRTDPWWMNGSIQIDLRTVLWGPQRYSYTDVGEPVTTTVRMPHGDDHRVTLQLQRQAFGRPRGRRPQLSWCVDWNTQPGIPTRNTDRGRIQASGVHVSDAAAEDGGWVEEASAEIVMRMTRDRIRYGYQQERDVS